MEGRKIALLIDNCPAHPLVSDLTNVQLVFLPSNTATVLQPMGQGAIRGLEAHYRGRVVHRLCTALDKARAFLQARKILVFSWGVVPAQAIINCFREAVITPYNPGQNVSDKL